MSSAISRFTNALLAGSQENTLALAALNFDFSLYKVEASIEYENLGFFLSEERKNLAESVSQHVAARKLAYGKQVSEIARITALDANQIPKQTVSANKMGIDGIIIWAAATSGYEALGMQLLACMLARFWQAPEAVSI